jgi:putative transposase
MTPGEVRAFVVMPDHVHVIYESVPDGTLERVLQALKSASAHRLTGDRRRSAPLWQSETYDHIIRTQEEPLETWKYIEANPVRRGLAEAPEAYRWSSAWGRA